MPAQTRLLLLIPILLLLFAVSSAAESGGPAAPPADWWKKSSLDPAARYPGLLKKFDFSFNYTNITGNTDGYALGVGTALTLRHGRWTGLASYDNAKKKYTQGTDHISNQNRTTKVEGQFDLCRYGYLAGAAIWEKDTNNDLDQRRLLIGGLGSYLVSSEALNLGAFLGGGQANEEYDAVVQRYTSLDHRTYNILYFYQTFDWQLSQWLQFSQGFRWIRSFSEMNEFGQDPDSAAVFVSGRKARSLIKGKAEIQVPIRKNFNLFVSYQVSYDSHPWPGNHSTDAMTTYGIRFSY
ncbi:hypothetical protein JCM30471_29370 [Desulfuromonas carbonis]|uniref:DUF481 domain-containing protein n=1 Tax=Desulfuromonas sp. DDH964 TaxID=1823759 RepID=UPI00078C13A6|nr:DUF481 domain-containing protein [Desulfuromonas sp. DDH964]AMV71116.1 hypothetical protein DBW_0731 [Desulfuromonas sp. DDH964]